jgi:type VI secretion system secreted protein Hcp
MNDRQNDGKTESGLHPSRRDFLIRDGLLAEGMAPMGVPGFRPQPAAADSAYGAVMSSQHTSRTGGHLLTTAPRPEWVKGACMMRHAKMVLSALCLVVTGWLGTAEAFDAYLFIPGFQSESQDKGHEKWIKLYQVSWGHAHVGGGAAGMGRAQFQDVSVQKFFDSTSPALATAVAAGQLFPNAIIELVNADQNHMPFAKLELGGVSITTYEASGAAGGQTPHPVESIKLNFCSIVWSYIPQDPSGVMRAPIQGRWALGKC